MRKSKDGEMSSILETDRLTLREFTLDDADFIVRLMNTPGWLEFIGDRNMRSRAAAESYLENGPIKSYRDRGFGLWLVQTKTPVERIGMCGILKRESLQNPDIGFAFLPEFTGSGYAFEAATATLEFATARLKLHTIHAITLPGNRNSIKLLNKLGFKVAGTYSSPTDNQELLLFTSANPPLTNHSTLPNS